MRTSGLSWILPAAVLVLGCGREARAGGTTDTVIGVELAPDGRRLLIYEGSGAHGGGAIGWRS